MIKSVNIKQSLFDLLDDLEGENFDLAEAIRDVKSIMDDLGILDDWFAENNVIFNKDPK